MPKPKYIKSQNAYYDPNTDTIYAPDSIGEFYTHEMFHAKPDTNLIKELKPLYENLNDQKLKEFGANLEFVKRIDPNHFYQPEELGARVAVARKILKDVDINEEFLNNLRKNENKYGNNVRDLLKMFNNENLIQILNMKKHLIPKNQLGGPIARLAQPTNNKGSWGNRGSGNEGQSFIENALYTIGDLGGLLTVGDKLLHPEKYEVKTGYGTPVEIDGKTVYPLDAPEQEQIGYPTLIPGLKGVPTKELTEFFKTKWGPAYNSLASTKSRLLKLGRSAELPNSKSYRVFQELDTQLKQMVDKVNESVIEPVTETVDDVIKVTADKLKNSKAYKALLRQQEKSGALGRVSKRTKESIRSHQVLNDGKMSHYNPGRPAVVKTSEDVINTFKGWTNKSKKGAEALNKYEKKVAKGINEEALKRARLECARDIVSSEPGSFTAKQREILGL